MRLNPFTHGRRKVTFILLGFVAIAGGFGLCAVVPVLAPHYGTFTAAVALWMGIALGGHLADQKLLDKNTPLKTGDAP